MIAGEVGLYLSREELNGLIHWIQYEDSCLSGLNRHNRMFYNMNKHLILLL